LSEAYQIIFDHGYQEPPEAPDMEYGAIHGMIGAYGDPYTHFTEPVQAELRDDTLSGSYGGIGATMSRDENGFVVLHPFPESPAKQAGIQDGDRLLQVDDLRITPDLPMDDIIAAVRGPEGKTVTLQVARPPEDTPFTFEVERENIPLPSVTWNLDTTEPRLGIIRVNVIAASTPTEIQEAVTDLQNRGATAFALDLRGNGGGLLSEGVDIARLFLTEGIIIEQHFKGEDVKTHRVEKPGDLNQVPLTIFVDGNTASAAEIIAGSLHNHQRALVIGTPTFGKNTIQLLFDLKDKSSLSVTSAIWWVPDLEPPIGEGGLLPDILISDENAGNTDAYLETARQHFFDP
jgi:carboxyl-terminal processing protease